MSWRGIDHAAAARAAEPTDEIVDVDSEMGKHALDDDDVD